LQTAASLYEILINFQLNTNSEIG